ncbi:hypothetical protein ACFQ0T_05620 [Kitasatospora gansuensis]
MTTTLRPESPEEPLPGEGRTRRWLICVNGRPVGGLRTTSRPYGEQSWGEISELEVTGGAAGAGAPSGRWRPRRCSGAGDAAGWTSPSRRGTTPRSASP